VAYEAIDAAWQGEIGGSHPEAAYQQFVAEGLATMPEDPFRESVGGWLLGSPTPPTWPTCHEQGCRSIGLSPGLPGGTAPLARSAVESVEAVEGTVRHRVSRVDSTGSEE
jgi:hypothetical protein